MITIVADTTAYLTRAEAAEMGVVMVPMSYSISGSQSVNEGYADDDAQACSDVAGHMESAHTSQATLSAFTAAFSSLRRAGSEILCLTMSSRLSGTYSNAVIAARELGGTGIEVVDSLTTCAGLYILVRRAFDMIKAGESLGAIAAKLSKLRERVRLCFSVDDMTPLRRSGRLGSVRMSVSTVLNIRPILEVKDGAVVSAGIARGRVDQANKLCSYLRSTKGCVLVDNFLGEEAARQLMARLSDGERQVELRYTGPVLGAHLGSGCVGIAFIDE